MLCPPPLESNPRHVWAEAGSFSELIGEVGETADRIKSLMNLFPEGCELTPEVLGRALKDDSQELEEASPSRTWMAEFLSSLTCFFRSPQGNTSLNAAGCPQQIPP